MTDTDYGEEALAVRSTWNMEATVMAAVTPAMKEAIAGAAKAAGLRKAEWVRRAIARDLVRGRQEADAAEGKVF